MSIHEPRTFRATPEAWLGKFLLPLAFFVLLTVTAQRAALLNPTAAWTGLVFLLLLFVHSTLMPLLRDWLLLDGRSIEGSLNGQYFHLYWTEVLAAWVHEHRGRFMLCLGTRNGTLVVPLRFFDQSAVWKRVKVSVAPAALEPSAVHLLPDYRDWAATRAANRADALEKAAQPDAQPCLVTDHWLVQVTGWTGLTIFLLGALSALKEGHLAAAGVLFGLAAVSISVLLSWGITEFTGQGVQRSTLFGGWSIAWEDIRRVEVDPTDSFIVLVGSDCQVVLPGPSVWNGVAREPAMALFLAQLEDRCIPLRRTVWAAFRFSRNPRRKR